jgi:transcriptional regulator with XRE-family HTH domain
MLRITRERLFRGWSKSELARRATMTASDIGKIESERLVPYESQLMKIARAFGMPVDEAFLLMLKEHHGDTQ